MTTQEEDAVLQDLGAVSEETHGGMIWSDEFGDHEI